MNRTDFKYLVESIKNQNQSGRQIVLATSNMGKLRELEAMTQGLGIQILTARDVNGPDVDEDQDSYVGNATKKAQEWFQVVGLPTIADDSGLSILSLGGWPGVYTHRIADSDEEREQLIFDKLGDKPREAQAITVLVFHDGNTTFKAEGVLPGIIVPPRGSGGFGFDRILEVNGRTVAEMSPEEKNKISSRGQALRKLAAFLKDYYGAG